MWKAALADLELLPVSLAGLDFWTLPVACEE